MGYLLIEDVLVNTKDWEEARGGSIEAKKRLQKSVHGLELYEHVISISPDDSDYTCVTLRELDEEIGAPMFARIEIAEVGGSSG
jgi:hypothetical protein